MVNVLQYANTATVTSAASPLPGSWCRPQHRPTCCVAVYGGNSCCICIPTTATCFVIEMWGQGGNGSSGCCCGVGNYGGQGGSYGWVTCTIATTVQTLCVCTCNNPVQAITACAQTNGSFSRVNNCVAGLQSWCMPGGVAGQWTCNPTGTWCWAGNNNSPTLTGQYNTWLLLKNYSGILANTASSALTANYGSFLQTCCGDLNTLTPSAVTYTGCASCTAPTTTSVTNINNSIFWGCLCTCSCFSSPYVWLGACGWSDPAATSTPFGVLNKSGTTSDLITGACGGGLGVGGAAYAGGDQAWLKCSFACTSCFVQNGNFPGGGGMTGWGASAQVAGGCGAPGLVLISWC